MKMIIPRLILGSGSEAEIIIGWLLNEPNNSYMLYVVDINSSGINNPYISPRICSRINNCNNIRFVGNIYSPNFMNYLRNVIMGDNIDFDLLCGIRATGIMWGGAHDIIMDYNIRLCSVIHPSVVIDNNDVVINSGVVIHPCGYIGNNVNIGGGTLINTRAVIEHDVIIGMNCFIGPGVIILGGVKIGDNVNIGAGAVIRNGIIIGNNVFIEMGCNITRSVPDGYRGVSVKSDIVYRG